MHLGVSRSAHLIMAEACNSVVHDTLTTINTCTSMLATVTQRLLLSSLLHIHHFILRAQVAVLRVFYLLVVHGQ